MAHTNPLTTIKHLAGETLKVPVAAAGTAASAAGAAVGLARTAADRVSGAVGSLVGDREQAPEEEQQSRPPADQGGSASQDGPTEPARPDIDPEEPVNVTEELGLDPAPVAKPRKRRAPAKKPVTGIDAAADASAVDVTPADVADAVAPADPDGSPDPR